ncbi:MAG: hypothetical protein LUH02_09595 [Erysipelotrichaceae bacterium]|nr:hypothetical protein [Erysipelotrichaceae bacterium]
MQLLYANDGINYRTISKSSTLNDHQEKALLNAYMKYDFVSHNDLYSSISNEPEALQYAVSNLNNALPQNYLIITKTGHMSHMTTPSYYFHGLLENVDDDFFKEQFFEIFNYQFINDLQISQYNHIDNYTFKHDNSHKVILNDEQLIVILATFMKNEKLNRKTKIIVDHGYDNYNQISRNILSSIYHYLPYELRKRHGFLSYSKDGNGGNGRVSFVLCPKEEIMNIDNTFIQLDHIDLKQLDVPENYLNYAIYLVKELDDESRKQHFEKLSTLAIHGRLKIDDCVTYYANLKKWEQGTQEKLLPEWINYIDQNSFRKGPLYELMVDIIHSKVSNDYYNQYLFDILNMYHEKVSSLSLNGAKTIRFADCVGLTIDEDMFLNWCNKQLKKRTQGIDTNHSTSIIKLKNIYQQEIDTLQNMDIGSNQFKELVNKYITSLTYQKAHLEQQINQFQDEELEKIGQEFSKLNHASLKEFQKKVKNIKSHILFEENIDIFSMNIEEWMHHHLNISSANENQLIEMNQFLEDIKNDISYDIYQNYKDLLNHELDIIKKEKKNKTFIINDKESVLNAYYQLSKDIDNQFLSLNDSILVEIQQDTLTIKVKDFKDVLLLILNPQPLKDDTIQYLDILYKTDLLETEHFPYLLETSNDYQLKKVIDYYLKKTPLKISPIYMARMLNQTNATAAKKIADSYSHTKDEDIQLFVENIKKKKPFGFFK